MQNLAMGYVVETTAKSFTGNLLYSDYLNVKDYDRDIEQTTFLNMLAYVPVLGIVTGVARIALGIIHVLGHLVLAAVCSSTSKGHLYHAAKGLIEIGVGCIEAMPIVGRVYAWLVRPSSCVPRVIAQSVKNHSFAILKIYNPEQPDSLDTYSSLWANWKSRADLDNSHYIKADHN